MTKITIEKAAVCSGGMIFSLPPPARHDDVVNVMRLQGVPEAHIDFAERGFLTSDGRFVERITAMRIAREAGQLIHETSMTQLMTDDVW